MDGLTITGYEYALSTNNGSTYGSYQASSWTSGTSFTISGLTNGTLYKVKIRAVNSLGGGAESIEKGEYKPNAVPAAPAAATLTAGDATDTFTWSAPASNGSTITKYAYQVSTDNGSTWYSTVDGTLNGETETANLSVALATQYKASSYKLRVRAFNNGTNGGFGSYSTISAGTGVWVLGSGPDSTSCVGVCSQSCSCGGCDSCGTNTGTQTASKTGSQSRTCYTWTRSGSTTSSIRNANGIDACNAAYGDCGSFGACGTFTACGSCSGCGTWNNVTSNYGLYPSGPFTFAGTEWYVEYSPTFGGNRAWVADNSGYAYDGSVFCGSGSSNQGFAAHLLYTCSVTGATRVTFVGCSN